MITIIVLSPLLLGTLAGAVFALHHARRMLDVRQSDVVRAALAWRNRPSIQTDRALCAAIDRYNKSSP